MTSLDIDHYRRLAFEANRTIIDTPGEPAYQVKPRLITPGPGEWYWQLALVHYLTGPENVGKHNLYIELLSEIGTPIRTPFNVPVIAWTWEGRREGEAHPSFGPDKDISEPGGNVDIYWGMRVEAWIALNGLKSDSIRDVHTMWPDNQPGNTLGHHSCLAIWVKRQFFNPLPPEPPEPPVVDSYRLAVLGPEGRVVGYEQYLPGLPPKGRPCWVILKNGQVWAWRGLES